MDILKLIDAHKYDHYYFGDKDTDIITCLETLIELQDTDEATECFSQTEDALLDASDVLKTALGAAKNI